MSLRAEKLSLPLQVCIICAVRQLSQTILCLTVLECLFKDFLQWQMLACLTKHHIYCILLLRSEAFLTYLAGVQRFYVNKLLSIVSSNNSPLTSSQSENCPGHKQPDLHIITRGICSGSFDTIRHFIMPHLLQFTKFLGSHMLFKSRSVFLGTNLAIILWA